LENKNKVAIVKYKKPTGSLREAIELSGGFSDLKPSDAVIIKPNALTWDNDHYLPPYGFFTTTRMVEDMVILLKEFGVTNISIAEGAVKIYEDTPDSEFVMKKLGYEKIVKRYGAKLIDLNKSESEKIELIKGLDVSIAQDVLNIDFFIDLPVMKTHAQTKVSLGFKNLKGCLKTASKRLCHHPEIDLDLAISLIAEKIAPDLTVLDGIYILEKGPMVTGKAHRSDLIVASTDILAADVVGTTLMGLDPNEIAHLKYYADRGEESLDLKEIDLKGEDIDAVKKPMKWDWSWNEENTGPTVFDRMGIKGAAVPKYDTTLCTGCSPVVNMANIFLISAKMQGGQGGEDNPFSNFEILSGKKMLARPGYDRTILLGNCIIKANKGNANIKGALAVKGCPPPVEDLKNALKICGVDFVEGAYDFYMGEIAKKYEGKEEFDETHFNCS
jgi:uncharacterized protein (DUF362 family)